MSLTIYTDGANSLKNRVGGCAAVITKDGVILKELAEAFEGINITNNSMELSGVILGCKYVLANPGLGKDVLIISDSEYVVNGSASWMNKWKLNGWKGMGGPVKNRPLWEAIDYLKTLLDLKFKWTRGHAGDSLNILADKLAVDSYTKLMKKGIKQQ